MSSPQSPSKTQAGCFYEGVEKAPSFGQRTGSVAFSKVQDSQTAQSPFKRPTRLYRSVDYSCGSSSSSHHKQSMFQSSYQAKPIDLPVAFTSSCQSRKPPALLPQISADQRLPLKKAELPSRITKTRLTNPASTGSQKSVGKLREIISEIKDRNLLSLFEEGGDYASAV